MNLFTLIKSDNYVLFALIDISQLHNQQSTFVLSILLHSMLRHLFG